MPSKRKKMSTLKLFLLPYRWVGHIADLLEKRPFNVVTIFCFTLFVALGRLTLEWIGGRAPASISLDWLSFCIFYWFSFYAYAGLIGIFAPGTWRQRANVVLVGIFCGLLPPLLDLAIYGIGHFRYSYFWSFPSGWNWYIYNPIYAIPAGEALVLWLTIIFTACYIHYRFHTPHKTLLASIGAYAVTVIISGGMVWLSSHLADSTNIQGHWSKLFFLLCCEIYFTIMIYLALSPNLTKHLIYRLLHALPFVALLFAGAAFVGHWPRVTLWTALCLLVFIAVALVQNDYYDQIEDRAQGRSSPVAAADVQFFTICGALLLLVLGISNSALLLPLGLFFVAAVIYSFPLYRGKAYFPANIKIEGVWAASAFFAGVVTAWEHQLAGGNMFSVKTAFWGITQNPAVGFTPSLLWAVFLVFGGWSLLSTIKDYKDIQGDFATGVQTVYTLALRRGWNVERLQKRFALLACVLLVLPLPLLWAIGRLPQLALWGMVAAPGWFRLICHANSEGGFRRFLLVLTLYLAALAWALTLTPID